MRAIPGVILTAAALWPTLPAAAQPVQPPAAQTDRAARPADPPRWDFSDHPRLRLTGTTYVDFRLKVQADDRTFSPAPEKSVETRELSLGRVGIEGQVTRWIEFEVSRELTGEGQWRGVYVNLRPIAAVQLQAGQFKVPFSRERLTGPTNLDFVERNVGVEVIAPGYDAGVMLHGRLRRRVLTYAAGVFRGDPDTGHDTAADETLPGIAPLRQAPRGLVAWRVTARPLSFDHTPKWLRPLEVGANGTISEIDESLGGWRARALFGGRIFDPVYVSGRRLRLGADALLESGRCSISAEWLRGLDERRGQGVGDDDLPELEARTWSIAATAVLTGEDKSRVDRPRRPLFRGGYGALEVAARVGRLTVGSRDDRGEPPSDNPRGVNLEPNSDLVWTFGINYYPDRFFRVQLNAIRESFSDVQRTPREGESTFWSYVVRLQLAL